MTDENKILKLLTSGIDSNVILAYELMLSLNINELDFLDEINKTGRVSIEVSNSHLLVCDNYNGTKFTLRPSEMYYTYADECLDLLNELNIHHVKGFEQYMFKNLNNYQITNILLKVLKIYVNERENRRVN